MKSSRNLYTYEQGDNLHRLTDGQARRTGTQSCFAGGTEMRHTEGG